MNISREEIAEREGGGGWIPSPRKISLSRDILARVLPSFLESSYVEDSGYPEQGVNAKLVPPSLIFLPQKHFLFPPLPFRLRHIKPVYYKPRDISNHVRSSLVSYEISRILYYNEHVGVNWHYKLQNIKKIY